MDFMKWLSTLDELLYEVMGWLVFFPLTLWRTIVRPLGMMDYADRQLTLDEADQYLAALSPPLFLVLSLLLSHGVAVALGQPDAILADRTGLAGLIDDEASELVLRVLVFAAFALIAAVRVTRARGLPVDRRTLRLPFYAQCYPTGAFALGLGLGVSLAQLPAARIPGLAIMGASVLHYAVLETRWFAATLRTGLLRAAGRVALLLAEGLAVIVAIAFLFTR